MPGESDAISPPPRVSLSPRSAASARRDIGGECGINGEGSEGFHDLTYLKDLDFDIPLSDVHLCMYQDYQCETQPNHFRYVDSFPIPQWGLEWDSSNLCSSVSIPSPKRNHLHGNIGHSIGAKHKIWTKDALSEVPAVSHSAAVHSARSLPPAIKFVQIGCTVNECAPSKTGADKNGCVFTPKDANCDDKVGCTGVLHAV